MLAQLDLPSLRPEDLFGELPGTAKQQLAQLQRAYRRLANAVHPDRQPAPARKQAEVQFKRLGALWVEAQDLIATGRYGQVREIVVTSKTREYQVGAGVAQSSLATIYACRFTQTDGPHPGILKVVNVVTDNDLLAHETEVLRSLRRPNADPRFLPYLPDLLDSFRLLWDGAERRAEVFTAMPGFVPLLDVLKAYPGGLDPRDMAWIWRRLLVAIGFTHRAGLSHGAIFPENIWIHPISHGLVLTEWSYATSLGKPLSVIPIDRKASYPPPVFTKKPVTVALDIACGALSLLEAMGETNRSNSLPAPLQRFFTGCRFEVLAGTDLDAWEILREFDELLEKLYGPRQYRPLLMPTKN